jgi:hypothetical protein
MSKYGEFLQKKSQLYGDSGFKPTFIPGKMFDFQKYLLDWSLNKGRGLLATDCGTGKTFLELAYAENIVRHTNKNVLILTPLAVSFQTLKEAEKFDINASRSNTGKPTSKITITNYEQLHKFDPNDFVGVVCDESSILKNFDGARKSEITEFMRKVSYRLLATATAAPNDFIELGTSSEALGYLGFIDMLGRFFKNDNNNVALRRMYGEAPKFRFKGQSEIPFWQWVTSWARAMRMPSDIGFEDGDFILPKLIENKHVVKNVAPPDGMLFNLPARRLDEQRKEVRRTINERCGLVAEMVNNTNQPAFIGCHLNEEGRLLRQLIPDAIEISGADKDEKKEEKFLSFVNGESRVLITKPRIGAWGLNFQHCNHVVYFPSHSYEQYYQFVRRCWRFGQKREVTVDLVLTEGEQRVMDNLQRKSIQSDEMFTNLVSEMQNAVGISPIKEFSNNEEIPEWL